MPGRYYSQPDVSDLMQAGGGNPFYNPYMKGPDISGFGQLIGGILRSVQAGKIRKEQKALFEQEQQKKQEKEEYERAMKEARFKLDIKRFGLEQEKVGIQTEEKRRAAQAIEDRGQIEEGTKYHEAKKYKGLLKKAFGKKVPEWIDNVSDDYIIKYAPPMLNTLFSDTVMTKEKKTSETTISPSLKNSVISRVAMLSPAFNEIDQSIQAQYPMDAQKEMRDKLSSAKKEKILREASIVAHQNWKFLEPKEQYEIAGSSLPEFRKQLADEDVASFAHLISVSNQQVDSNLILRDDPEALFLEIDGKEYYYNPQTNMLDRSLSTGVRF